MKAWYVVYTHPMAEEKAARNLENQGFEVFLPRFKKLRRHARRVDEVIRPLFPRYLFVHFDAERDRWRSINGTFGVGYLICHGDTPVELPPAIVEEISGRKGSDGFVALDPPKFRKGDRVLVMDGPFADRFALCEEMPDSQRVVLLLDLLGRQVRVCTQTAAVQAVG